MDNPEDDSIAQGHPKFYEAVDKVTEELMAMSQEEFAAELEKHKDGDIAQFFMETGAAKLIMEDFKIKEKKNEQSSN